MQRRILLIFGGLSVLSLGTAGVGAWLRTAGGYRHGQLTSEGVKVFRGVARGVLDGSLPGDDALRNAALEKHLQRIATTISTFSNVAQNKVSQLVGILASAPGRNVVAELYVDWHAASVIQVQGALESMRVSRWALRQQSYHALRDLTNAAYFSDPEVWPELGYPGPRPV